MKEQVAEVLGLSDISPEALQSKTHGPDIIKKFTKLPIEKSQTDGYYTFLLSYAKSPFRDFESYLRFLTGLNEDNIQVILN